MLASEVIEKLQRIIDKHGDVEVFINSRRELIDIFEIKYLHPYSYPEGIYYSGNRPKIMIK